MMRRPSRAIVWAGLLALLLASCGGDETEAQDTEETEAQGTEEPDAVETTDSESVEEDPAPELSEVTIMLGGHAMSWASTYIAQDRGFFADEGVEVEIVASPEGAPAAIAAVVSDSVFLTFSGAAGQVAAIIEGAPVKWAFVSALGLAPEICATPEWLDENGLDASSPLEDKLAALPGSRLTVFNPGDNLEQLYRFLWANFELGDIDTDGTEIVNTSNLAGSIAAASQNHVDVMASTPPGCQTAESQGVAETFLQPMKEVHELAIMPASVAMANEKSFEQYPNTLKAVVRAISRGNDVLLDDPEAAWPILQEQFSETPEEDLRAAFDQHLEVRAPEHLWISEDQFEAFKHFRELQGSGVGDLTYEEAINADLAREAEEAASSD